MTTKLCTCSKSLKSTGLYVKSFFYGFALVFIIAPGAFLALASLLWRDLRKGTERRMRVYRWPTVSCFEPKSYCLRQYALWMLFSADEFRYWDWSLDTEPQNPTSMHAFETQIFQPDTGFGGNGFPVNATAEQNRLNITGNTGGGCVMNGPFAPPYFTVNLPTPHCLKRDFVPWILNTMADSNLVDEVMAQPDYTTLARMVEKKQSFTPPNIHASGHFGVGGILGTMGNAAESPGGESAP
jgi:hypothetical protein